MSGRWHATKRISATVTPACLELIKRLREVGCHCKSEMIEKAITEFAEKSEIKLTQKQIEKLNRRNY